MTKKIIVHIDPLGNPRVEAEGFHGVGCTDATAAIEQALAGGGGVSREYKAEWEASGTTSNEQHQHSW